MVDNDDQYNRVKDTLSRAEKSRDNLIEAISQTGTNEAITAKIKECEEVIKEATPVIRVLLEEGRKEEAVELLTTMQEVIIMLGNKTEHFYRKSKRVSEFIDNLAD